MCFCEIWILKRKTTGYHEGFVCLFTGTETKPFLYDGDDHDSDDGPAQFCLRKKYRPMFSKKFGPWLL